MASIQPQHTAGVVFTQPIFKTDPFTDFNSNWNVNLMSCFDDTHQCKINCKSKFLLIIIDLYILQVCMHIFVGVVFLVH